ncbi:MAG TPA: APC family permease [Pseudonocardiaceae bacterium]|nr:APC family permease [Pseudonocardiaceae bacterium]
MSRPVENEAGLRRGAIGLREVLFQSITAMAPGAAIAASIPAGAAFAGGALPLAVIVALVACLFASLSIAELAKHLPAAGSVATYSSRGLHPIVGFLVAWGYLFVEALVPTLLLLQLGFTAAGTFNSSWGWPADLWWPWAMVGAVIIAVAGFWGARVSARLGTVLGAFEILVFVILAVLLIVKAGGANTLSVFTSTHTPAGHLGFAGVLAGSVYTVLAFSGFEAAAPLAEETKDPKRTIRRAVIGATLGIGAIYIFTTYAADVFVGPDKFGTFGTTGALSWEGIARASFGLFWILVFLAIINSTIANANAGMNVSTRTAYALARVGILPKSLARIHPVHRSPVVAVAAQFVLAVVATLALGFAFTPTTAFVLVATVIVVVVVAVYIIVNAACIGFFARFRRSEFNWFLHLVSPVLGILAFIPALLTAAGIPVFSFVTPLTPPISYAGPIVGVWMLIGVIYLVYLWTKHRQRVVDTGLVHLDSQPEPETAEQPA